MKIRLAVTQRVLRQHAQGHRVARRGGRLMGIAAAALLSHGALAPQVQRELPERLTDKAFWEMVSTFSEPGGFFRSDNFVSNETSFQWVIPRLQQAVAPGGVYVGVGPEQNFTYIAALRPRMAFIVDIRHQNALQHLLYKAVIELSPDRADFLSRLFSRPRPDGLDSTSSTQAMLEAFLAVTPDSGRYTRNLSAIMDLLTRVHAFPLTEEQRVAIEYVYGAFFNAGPEISYTFGRGMGSPFGRRMMPTYAELMIQADSAGVHRSFLASEDLYRVVRDLHRNNMLVPLTGNFAGERALRAVGGYLRERGVVVNVLYTSNVEQYLFQSVDDWRRFYDNVAAMPLDSSSTFIRAVFNFGMGAGPPGARSASLLAPMQDFITAYKEGRISSYYDAVQLSR